MLTPAEVHHPTLPGGLREHAENAIIFGVRCAAPITVARRYVERVIGTNNNVPKAAPLLLKEAGHMRPHAVGPECDAHKLSPQ